MSKKEKTVTVERLLVFVGYFLLMFCLSSLSPVISIAVVVYSIIAVAVAVGIYFVVIWNVPCITVDRKQRRHSQTNTSASIYTRIIAVVSMLLVRWL